jgi:predicted membrane-bound spermidine synthase
MISWMENSSHLHALAKPALFSWSFRAKKLYAISFFAGFETMAYEMLLGRALVPYFGGTIYTWGALIGIFLFGMSLGYIASGRLSAGNPKFRWLFSLFTLGGFIMILTPIFLDPVCEYLLSHFSDVRILAIIAALVFALIPAAIFAAVAPLCIRFGVHDVSSSGLVAGRLSALNTIGSILGTLCTSFFLVPHIGVRSIFVLLGLMSVGVGVFLGVRGRGE